jgi:hypothetical protein
MKLLLYGVQNLDAHRWGREMTVPVRKLRSVVTTTRKPLRYGWRRGNQAGHVHGRTDDLGYGIADSPVHVHDFNATLFTSF